MAVLAALYRRRRTGVGATIDLALHDLLVSLLCYMGQAYLLTGVSPFKIIDGSRSWSLLRA